MINCVPYPGAAGGIPEAGTPRAGTGHDGAGLLVRVKDTAADLVGNAMTNTRCAELASLAEQADIRYVLTLSWDAILLSSVNSLLLLRIGGLTGVLSRDALTQYSSTQK